MTRSTPFIAIVTVLALSAASLAAPDASQRLETGLSGAGDIQGDIIRLEAAGGSFIAIHRAHQTGEGRGGIVLLHDRRSNPDSPEVIRPLRLGLADAGWDTLALQLPLAYRGEGSESWRSNGQLIQARLQAGLDWLKSRGVTDRLIIAHGDSAAVALQFASGQAAGELQALVMLSTALAAGDETTALLRIDLPVLDLYAERDHDPVIDGAAGRKAAALEGGNTAYRQVALPGATAGFYGLNDSLLASVRAWLAAARRPGGA